jgi:SAM-dependent methyltransferase
METVLLCPQCLKEKLKYDNSTLICIKCKSSFPQESSTFFYDFRTQKFQSEKSFLIEEELDFHCNSIFQKYVGSTCMDKCRSIVKQLEPDIILDIGCGPGFFAKNIKGLFFSYFGFEPSNIPIGRGYSESPPENVFLFHDDINKKLPIRDQSIDLVLFMASYDHIEKPETVVRDAWDKLRLGGHLMIVMTNYAFWVKNLLNCLLGGGNFQHEHDHYCVHSPASLEEEILRFIPKARLERVEADDIFVPNIPKKIGFFYFNIRWVAFLNKTLKTLINFIFRLKHRGSTMALVFKKM